MAEQVSTARVVVDGMTCGKCEQRIEKAVRALDGVGRVTASSSLSEVRVDYDPDRVGIGAIHEAIRQAGYQVREVTTVAGDAAAGAQKHPGSAAPIYRFLGLVAVLAAVYLIIRYTVGFTFLPTVNQSMGYGLIFVVGLLTSLHCIAMCGGIVLSQGINREEIAGPARFRTKLLPSLLYNGGRVVSYTIIGGLVGALGSLFSLSTALKGAMPVIAGAFMLFLGIRMLGIFPWLSRLAIRLPWNWGEQVSAAASRRGPFVVGLLNGLMPCGPLQTMQVYALGTGSFFAGALSMFLFSLGTVPLLLGFGAISSLLSAKFNRRMLKASGVLVMVLGLVMFTRGMSLFGIGLPAMPGRPASGSGVAVARLAEGFQEVQTTVESGQYHPFVVQEGIPVRWTVRVQADDLNGCNNPLTVPQYGIRRQLVPGDNLIEFTPAQSGTITYTCWMGMISSTIRVVPDLTRLTPADRSPVAPAPAAAAPAAADTLNLGVMGASACCDSSTTGRFAGGKIPTDAIKLARLSGDGQVAEVTVNGDGYSPAVLVMQRGVKAQIRFVPERLTTCNYIVNFPDYRGGLDLSQGRLETPYLEVTEDFTFECGMGMLHGYVKVVDDLARVDLKEVRRQVAAFKPVAASAAGAGGAAGGGCCGQ